MAEAKISMLADPFGGRSIPEWIGKTPDSAVPEKVRSRVFARYKGRCYLSGIKILPGMDWQVEHMKSLALGGQNKESNLAPALTEPHKKKTKQEAGWKAKADRQRAFHEGTKTKPKGNGRLQGRPFPKRGDR